MSILYTDNDDFCCKWPENLYRLGTVPPGTVLQRDIKEVTADEIKGFRQAHLFAGIGGWAYALRLAGWPADVPVWTGSCPCPPFSTAGRKQCPECGRRGLRFFSGDESLIQEFGCPTCGWRDDRHLWPDMRRLIEKCRPPAVFGEQVAGTAGREWLAGVRADMEALGYAVGAADLCAASVGAPHPRQRLFWVAHTTSERNDRTTAGQKQAGWSKSAGSSDITGGLGYTDRERRDGKQVRLQQGQARQADIEAPWSCFDVVWCRDPKLGVIPRRVEPGVLPLAHGLPRSVGPGGTGEQRMELLAAKANRRGRIRGYGNAIVPQVAAVFIRVAMEWIGLV